MKALTGDINAKIAEGSSYFRPIITFLQDGQRGAHVVYQDASRAFDLWNDVSEMLRDRGDAQLVKYVNRVLSPLARAKKYAEWAQERNPGFNSVDNEKLLSLVPEIKRASAIAAVIARKAGAAKSRKSIKNARGEYIFKLVSRSVKALDSAIDHTQLAGKNRGLPEKEFKLAAAAVSLSLGYVMEAVRLVSTTGSIGATDDLRRSANELINLRRDLRAITRFYDWRMEIPSVIYVAQQIQSALINSALKLGRDNVRFTRLQPALGPRR